MTQNEENLYEIILQLKEKNIELETMCYHLQEENKQLLEKINEYQARNKEWQQQVQEITSSLARIDNCNTSLQNKLNDKDNFYRKEAEKHKNQLIGYESQLHEVVQENVKLKSKLNQIERLFSVKENEFNENIKTQNIHLIHLEEMLNKISHEYENEIAGLKESIKELETQLIKEKDMYIGKLDTYSKENIQLKNEIAGLNAIRNNCKKIIDEIASDYANEKLI